MCMGIDTARHHDHARGIDYMDCFRGKSSWEAQGRDPLTDNANVPGAASLGSDDETVFDQDVEHAANLLKRGEAVNDG